VVSNHEAFGREKSQWAGTNIYGQGDSWMGLDDHIIQGLVIYFFNAGGLGFQDV